MGEGPAYRNFMRPSPQQTRPPIPLRFHGALVPASCQAVMHVAGTWPGHKRKSPDAEAAYFVGAAGLSPFAGGVAGVPAGAAPWSGAGFAVPGGCGLAGAAGAPP